MKKDSALKLILISIIGILLLVITKVSLVPGNYYGLRLNFNGNFGGDHMYMNGYGMNGYGMNGYGMNGTFGFGTGSFAGIFTFIINLLIVLLVVALIVGLFMAAKNYFFSTQNNFHFNGGYTPVEKPKKTCEICGKPLESGWKVCPYCAAEIKEN